MNVWQNGVCDYFLLLFLGCNAAEMPNNIKIIISPNKGFAFFGIGWYNAIVSNIVHLFDFVDYSV